MARGFCITTLDPAFDDDIRGAPDHDEMFNVVSTQQNKLAPLINRSGIRYGQSGLSSSAAAAVAWAAKQTD